ncbi:MAG: CvpA family protein [Gammaproteobacteria bacterium]|nr:CvpA family protein [Gammaproteobacteria bacterium]
MTGIDIGILVIIAISTVISVIRGFFTEAVSLLTWVAALVIATLYAHQFGNLFRVHIEHDLARGVLAWTILFVGTMVIGGLINYLFSKLRAGVQLGAMDRVIGLFFGFLRGVLIVALIVMAAHLDFFTSLRESEVWHESRLLGYYVQIAKALHGLLPPDVSKYFDFMGDAI